MSKYMYEFDPDEPNNTAATVFQLAARGGPRVLDVGSGPGIVAAELVRRAGKDVTCLDVDTEALAEAKQAGVTTVAVANLEEPEWYETVPSREYDVVILADILEHLHDGGEAALRTLREQKIVAPDAMLVISFPNVAHESIVAQLLAGAFRYTDTGLLDRTHVRFFTLTTMRDLLEASGYLVEEVHRTIRSAEDTVHADALLKLSEQTRAVLKDADEASTYQYIVLARPSDAAGQLAIARSELERLRADLVQYDVVRERLATTSRTLEQERAHYEEVHSRLLEHEDLVARLETENRSLQATNQDLKTRLDETQRKLERIRSSRAYQVSLRLRQLAGPAARVIRSGRRR